ncbi:DUF3380 domain-containing protein [Rhizobium deserti]|uniref:DUF3380 domain-containing protein n=1 Tax=Rhizobium deserti TaxID=2547961 RepID=A0A4R5UGW5_9HYPH|nr:N-acetylmuramidase domain-containing protein [Rhizobium deserti]TDK35190.1 DUF3380 domain-containing protein [Rhizobium deserti]
MTNFNGFMGAAKRIEDIDLPRLGVQISVGEDELHAFMEAETRGSGFDSQGRPRILFERHKFYKYCPEEKRAAAVKAGLANPKAGGYGKESEQYGKLQRAMVINEHAALLSCSWGLAQVMGFNHELAGYPSVEAMILAFMEDEEAHLQAAVTFIKNSGLDDELRRHDWKGFAKGYNGTGYAVNKYDQKLAAAYAKWSKINDTPFEAAAAPIVPAAPPQSEPTDAKLIEKVQQLLRDKGYPEVGNVDNKPGSRTRNAILAFEADNGMALSGAVSDALLVALIKAPIRQNAPARENATAKDLKDAPSVKMGDMLKKLGAGVLAASGLGGLAEGAGDLDKVISGVNKLKAVTDVLLSVSPWILGAVAGSVAIYFGSNFIKEQVLAYREGRHV